jgi:tryptophan-rich hypothetical protein
MARMSSRRNPVNFKKLPGSKWTAARPQRKEKHFIVLDWERNEAGERTDRVVIEAVYSGVLRRIHWRQLGDPDRWLIGWR